MTNEEKYKTPNERIEAFLEFCTKKKCDKCECSKQEKKGISLCEFVWLTLEAEEEKLLRCPFCGGEADTTLLGGHEFSVRCYECLAETDTYETRGEAIAAWNRRVK